MVDFLYNTGSARLWDTLQPTDLIVDTVKVMLVTSSYVADRDNDFIEEGVNDANEHEITGTGYVAGFAGAGRLTLASKTITVDKANDRTEFDCADLTWTSIDAGTPSQMLVIVEITNDLASPLIGHVDSGGFPVTTNGGDLTVTINAEGLIQLSTA